MFHFKVKLKVFKRKGISYFILFTSDWGKEETKMKINEKYKLVFRVEGNLLTFTGTIIAEDDTLLTFIDKFNKTLTYNKAFLISAEEVGE